MEKIRVYNLDGDLIEYEVKCGINFYIILDKDSKYKGYRYARKMFIFKTPKIYVWYKTKQIKKYLEELQYGYVR
jgi:hypothetical protein